MTQGWILIAGPDSCVPRAWAEGGSETKERQAEGTSVVRCAALDCCHKCAVSKRLVQATIFVPALTFAMCAVSPFNKLLAAINSEPGLRVHLTGADSKAAPLSSARLDFLIARPNLKEYLQSTIGRDDGIALTGSDAAALMSIAALLLSSAGGTCWRAVVPCLCGCSILRLTACWFCDVARAPPVPAACTCASC